MSISYRKFFSIVRVCLINFLSESDILIVLRILFWQLFFIKAKILWLQFGIENKEAKEIVEPENIVYISNKCIKQEYQRLFLKVNPVFPALLKN